jgi:hypothetical protein
LSHPCTTFVVSDELCDDGTSDRDSIFERTYTKCKFIAANYDVKVIKKTLRLLHLGRSVV